MPPLWLFGDIINGISANSKSLISGSLGLGFRRLSIIDLSTGHQPMSDDEKTIWVVFNGEIFNFKEIRKELEDLGHIFRTRCDTEVIVHGYKQWGENALNRFNGMFGLAIWDECLRKLIVARDPMGIKPVYYALKNGALFFGSEIRTVRAGLQARPSVDPAAVSLFLRYRYTPSPYTLFSEIRKLAPGEMLTVQNGEAKTSRWYLFEPKPFSHIPNDEEATETLLELYKKALKRHLISDVPLGLLLSGGIDSGLLLGLMNLYGKSWPTYTVGYGSSFMDDELIDAAETAKIFSAKNYAVKLNQQKFENWLPKVIGALEEPVASSSIVPMFFLCQRARLDVKVVLIGQGPDELFGGYKRHIGVRYGAYWRRIPQSLRFGLADIINKIPRAETLKRGVYALSIPDRLKRYQYVFSIMPGQNIDCLFRSGLLPKDAGDEILQSWSGFAAAVNRLDELGGFQLLELRSSLPDELLMYADKMSMAHALEVRVPFLDREVVEYVQRLDSNFKVRNGVRKWIHRRVCKRFLPETIIKRKKRGFAVNVVDNWFRSSMNSKMDGYLRDEHSKIYQYLEPKRVNELYMNHINGQCDNHKILFSLIVLEEWLRLL